MCEVGWVDELASAYELRRREGDMFDALLSKINICGTTVTA